MPKVTRALGRVDHFWMAVRDMHDMLPQHSTTKRRTHRDPVKFFAPETKDTKDASENFQHLSLCHVRTGIRRRQELARSSGQGTRTAPWPRRLGSMAIALRCVKR